jgi:phage regulator Rha-like protein
MINTNKIQKNYYMNQKYVNILIKKFFTKNVFLFKKYESN